MSPQELKQLRRSLGWTQEQLAKALHTTRITITRYENGTRRIPGVVEVALKHMRLPAQIPMVGIVAAGAPIEPVPQSELVEVPPGMLRGGEYFALRVKGESMLDAGILPGDLVIVRRQTTARSGQTVIALVKQEATIKTFYQKADRIELHPANPSMTPIVVTPTDDFRIEGILVGVVRYCR
ncbi:MAG TPA: transcriptional repressor LexA [Nitrospiraceae bacterium]|nr:transcriptional repressor LexA [Nitrospiraceae bacterium]